jgi:hypothetical protein
MENVIPTAEPMKKEPFKVIPVLERTRERLKNDMMKVDTYDSYINKKLDRLAELEKIMINLPKAE